MFNVKYIVENESKNAFIWAHNEHINKEMYYLEVT
jgi:hypothetical protein